MLPVMADDASTPEKDGFSSGETINWFYKTSDGSVYFDFISLLQMMIIIINAIFIYSTLLLFLLLIVGG